MLKRKRDFNVLEMLRDINSRIESIDGRAPDRVNKDAITRMLHNYDTMETPFGQLVSSFDFSPTPTDDPVPIRYINPFALLWWLSHIYWEFYNFMSNL